MLTTLRISGLAVVDAVEVRFGPGLNVLTGETGAGKSILVNALHLVLGGRMTADVLREGADEAVVEALFDLPAAHPVFGRLDAAGLPVRPEPGAASCELLVRRVAARGGRGRAFVNGALCTVSMLETALRGVVDISGQHEHVSLLDPSVHLELLDAFAGLDAISEGGAEPTLLRYRAAHAALAALVREREALAADEGERARRADYLAFQLRELESADPRPGELEALEDERRVLASAEKLREAARAAEALAYGEEGSASERVGQAARALAEASLLDRRLEAPLGLLRSAAVELEEAGRELGRYAETVGGDPERLAAVEDRHELLRALARKHGGTLEGAIARRDQMRGELARLQGGGERLAVVQTEIEQRGREAARLAAALSRARAEAAQAFAEAVRRELAGLAMGRCRLEVALLPPEAGVEVGGKLLGPAGAERAEILIAPNPGEPPRGLGRIASGGELSRLLLAVKRTISRRDPVATYVFDEVDAGIGGAVAEAMGRVLSDVSKGRQVICITHLPQVAAFADRHHRVEKRVAGGRTHTGVELLGEDAERRQEVARMMAGVTVTASALEHAAALMAAARQPAAPAAASERGRRAVPARAAARRVARAG
ncbi:DNA repair protein RecN [Anaeromyxobacter dehalogenans]|uniref:DNA repair protein RecN n=1 Tax=Anaeromyxobacter dehalogenans (strain 2CP-C) TaxID=290397 RepID=Q2INX5_ANADE|nr:DNA repair protein RecN [Anaeromyxobacter dehalogenans]ABC80507.1 DNA replication and repair protein RecN [Anaeromyxobacter dehalogenans 2CP-C]